MNTACMARLAEQLDALNLSYEQGLANFLLVHFDAKAGPQAAHVAKALAERNIMVRGMAPYGLPDCLRISTGTEAQMDQLYAALRDILASH